MSAHRFHVGDLVRVEPQVSVGLTMGPAEDFMRAISVHRRRGLSEVTRVLPELMNGEPQYRIRCIGQPDRVVRESELTPAVRKSELHH